MIQVRIYFAGSMIASLTIQTNEYSCSLKLFAIRRNDQPVQYPANENPSNFLRILSWLNFLLKNQNQASSLRVYPMMHYQRNDRGNSILVVSVQNNLSFWTIFILISSIFTWLQPESPLIDLSQFFLQGLLGMLTYNLELTIANQPRPAFRKW